MTKKLLATLLIVITSFSLVIFTAMPISASKFSNISTVESPQNHMSIDESCDGMTIQLSVGDNLVINLQSQPSTGFRWQLDQINASVLQKVSDQFIPPSPPVIGGIGTEMWVFQAIGVGSSPIGMEYSRSFQAGAARTFNITVNVTAITVPASSNLTIGIFVASLTALIAFFVIRKPRQTRM
jgi:inhibitor of cysteine peptidase